MIQSNTQALSQEIKQSAQKILKHLDDFESENSHAHVQRESQFANLYSNLQTDERTNLLRDVNRWTEYRCDSYQKFDQPLLDQVETNQKIAVLSTSEAIPILQDQIDEFDAKLINAKSRLSTLTENVIHSANDLAEKSKNNGLHAEPQLQLNFPQPSIDDSNEKEISRIEYENEVIQQLRARQEYFLNALQNFDKAISAINEDLQKSREDNRNLQNENKTLKIQIEKGIERPKLSTGNEISMQIDCFNTNLQIDQSQFYEIHFDENQYVINKDDANEDSENKEDSEKIEDEEKNDDSEKVEEEKLNKKMVEYKLVFFSDEDVIIEPNDEFISLPRSEADEYFRYIENNNKSEKSEVILNEKGSEMNNDDGKFQYTNHNPKNLNQSFDPSSITSEISYEIKLNDKSEVVFDLTDEIGNTVMGSFSPESSVEMQDEIQKDIQHLITMNASTTDDIQSTNNQSNPNTDSQNKSTSNSFDVSINNNPDFSQNKNSTGKVNFTFGNSTNEGPQPIVPIGIRPKEDQNGDVGFRIFFRQNNDALVLDTNVRQRTNDGLIVFNTPSPNILVRIENGFSSEFVTRCRENPNLNFILMPYRPEGSKERIVGLCENKSESYRSNFFRETRNLPCVWNSFPVRPRPPIYRSANYVQQQPSAKVEAQRAHPPLAPKDIPYLSPQQIFQMRNSAPSSIAARKNSLMAQRQQKNGQLARVRHSYNETEGKGQLNDHYPSPRKMLQIKNECRIISPDSKSRNLKQRKMPGSIHRLNKQNET